LRDGNATAAGGGRVVKQWLLSDQRPSNLILYHASVDEFKVRVKVVLQWTENSLADHHEMGYPPRYAPASRARVSERTSVPKPDEHQTMTMEPDRRRLIAERLQDGYYEAPEPSERIAIAVYAALHEPGQGSPLPH
jgi:hypothetical protein